eukprot:gene33075-40011_t
MWTIDHNFAQPYSNSCHSIRYRRLNFMDSTPSLTSLELWAASKFIARECATINKDYFICKKKDPDNLFSCLDQEYLVTTCAEETVAKLKSKHTKQFDDYVKCLNYNDYNYDKCRKLEDALRKCWNNDGVGANSSS